ncbi:hypothetical protein N7478_002250 [Penicillium angulare]|uniref:uncharacterized protein n=1 Tax=Penicillium angulare TaxID=116970 RepID=UPI0025406B40|nr:uncharacterized protein N7478_002250 [Penicillium angulare]KAJ5289220.1 hypothetical protein N7478_002250 [Penicillium angulare]
MQLRNRMAMTCSSCRLVNGQAPPGTKKPEELGRWRYGAAEHRMRDHSDAIKLASWVRRRGILGTGPSVEAEPQQQEVENAGDLTPPTEEEQSIDSESSVRVEVTEKQEEP